MFVGIDISKASLDVALLQQTTEFTEKHCPNTVRSALKLATELTNSQLVVIEATGGYEQTIVKALLKKGIPVSVVNPKRIRDFAKSAGKLAKTDQVDARILAQYASVFEHKLRRTSAHDNPDLKSLCALRQDILQNLTQTKNRLRLATSGIKNLLQETVRHFQTQLETVDAQMESLLEQCPYSHVLSDVKGVGMVLTATLIAELPELGRINAKEVAALVGVAPFNCDSGTFRGRRRVWGGRQSVRKVLYMAAFSAKRFNPAIKTYYEHLIARGKPFKVVMTACMRKLLVILNAKMRDYYNPKQSEEPHKQAA